jgi:itaconate CoA-transferase
MSEAPVDVRSELPLEGVTVVAVEQAVAAPLATRHLADLGARVIKIEHPDGGDFARSYNTDVEGLSSFFVWLNRSKESVAVDLKTSQGIAIVQTLISSADVFVQNLSPGAAQRLGLGADELRKDSPRLIAVSMSGYGNDGPESHRRAYDMLVQGEAGVTAVTGTPHDAVKVGIAVADIAAGMYAYSGVLTALFRRERYGVGSTVDVSMFDAVVEWMGYPLNVAKYTKSEPGRHGVAHPSLAPYDAFPTAGGQRVLIGVQNDSGWRRLLAALELDRIGEDPRLATNIGRVAHRDEVNAAISQVTAALSAEDLMRRLDEAGVPAGRLNSVTELISHPQLVERARWVKVQSEVGELDAVKPPLIFDGFEPRMDPIPRLGAQTDEVLRSLGYPLDSIEALRAEGVIA